MMGLAMDKIPWQNRYTQKSWEIIHRRLSIIVNLAAIPSEVPICNAIVEVRSGLKNIRGFSRNDGRFYLSNLNDGVYDLVLSGIADPLMTLLRIQLTAFKSDAASGLLKSLAPLDFDLEIEGAAIVNHWISALHFEIKNHRISLIN